MKNENTQLTLHNDSIDFLTVILTQFAMVARAMRQHERAERMETIRNTIQAQFYPVE